MLKNMPSAKVLQTFECTARLGSFTLATKELYLTQSAISRQIKGLEETLGFEVFKRDNNRIELTEEGQVFYTVVSKSLASISAVAERLRKGESRKRLFIALPPTFASRWLAPRLASFRDICPATLTISTHSNYNYSSFGEFDCQVGFGSDELGTIGGKVLFPEIIVPACSTEIKKKILSENSIEGIPLLHTLTGTSRLPYWEQWIDRCNEPLINPQPDDIAEGIEFSTQDQTIVAAIHGMGIAMVDITVASTIFRDGFLEMLGDPVNTVYSYWAFPPPGSPAGNDPARIFYEWLQDEAMKSILSI